MFINFLDIFFQMASLQKLVDATNISVAKKKNLLVKSLSDEIASAFSINTEKIKKSSLRQFAEKIGSCRKITDKLRSINYYLEHLNVKSSGRPKIPEIKNPLIKGDIDALELTAYRLIEEAAFLDKKSLERRGKMEKKLVNAGKIDAKTFTILIAKQTALLEHLEAKLPPAKFVKSKWLSEPFFAQWKSRIFSITFHIRQLCEKEKLLLKNIKSNASIRKKLSVKIDYLVEEQKKLLQILHDKSKSISQEESRKTIHNFTVTVSL